MGGKENKTNKIKLMYVLMKHIHDIRTMNINNPLASTLVSSHTSQGRTPNIREDTLEEKKEYCGCFM